MKKKERQEKAKNFILLLEKQIKGDETVKNPIQVLGQSFKLGSCLYVVYKEWLEAFSFQPGRKDILPYILSLVKKILEYRRDSISYLYDEEEWREVVNLRGPIVNVTIKKCKACSRKYTEMGTSGFYQAYVLVCSKCGDVYLTPDLGEKPIDCPGCNGVISKGCGCPHCHNKEGSETVDEISPYEYFYYHKFTKAPGL
ncbi:hypothetical protein [Candidatus Uabimicrobium amorphum]|uniref:Uncharacterized protein n=1 Tax=Uabimicrobium amorphum TaxID=2596890 RepID=A0A5S9INZ5_UABAM|nr:hypothetical protein [Candidatus Uabimicrobium amorphum]BBM85037.1 hypothetical protein UABAM_03400 [Candidatus Uabimicrobium amorphum]